MILCDFKCRSCGLVNEVWVTGSPKNIVYKCDCGGDITWKPNVGRIDAFKERHDEQSDLNLRSFRQLDKWAKKNGKAIVSNKEFESNHMKSTSLEERIDRGRPAIREAVRKSYYRLKHGYIDHPKLEKDKLPKQDSTGFVPDAT